MARELDHIALANRNHEALQHLLENAGRFPEWITTIAFYKAVQLVEASFSHTDVGNSSSHSDRLRTLKQEKTYHHVYKHYRPLWSASTIARYLQDHENSRGYRCFADYMKADQVVTQLVNHRLKQIEHSITRSRLLSAEAVRALELL